MSNLSVTKSYQQPVYKTLDDAYVTLGESRYSDGKELDLRICNNGYQSTVITIDIHMYDALRALLEDHRVVAHVESIRDKDCIDWEMEKYLSEVDETGLAESLIESRESFKS